MRALRRLLFRLFRSRAPKPEVFQSPRAASNALIAKGQVLNLRTALELRAQRYASSRTVCPDCDWPDFFNNRFCQNPLCLGDLRNVPATRRTTT